MKKLLFALALAPCLAHASKSLSLNGVTGTYTVPNSPLFSSLGSFWVDLRIHGYTVPAGSCTTLVQVEGPTQFRLCDPNSGGLINAFSQAHTPGGVPNFMSPPNIPVIGESRTNPAVLSLASAPFPAVMSPGSVVTVWGATDPGCAGLNGNHHVQAVSGFSVTIDYDATGCAYAAGAKIYGQDFLLRLSFNLTSNQIGGETWNVDGTGYSAVIQTIEYMNQVNLPEAGVQIGPSPTNLAYMRWCRGVIPVNGLPPTSSLTAPCGNGSVVADWEFEGNVADSGPNRLSLSFTPNVTYVDSPVYAPACNPGPQQTFRVGTTAALDGSRSFPLDGGSTLQMTWQLASSAEPGLSNQAQLSHWTSTQTTPFASFDSFTAGPLNFQLTVTDSSGQSTSCIVHHGAVATDDNGNISFADPRLGQILGPLTQLGSPNAPWPWLDTIEKIWADKLGGYQGLVIPGGLVTDFVDSWNKPQAGTIDCFQGQTTCTGHNTSFQDVFCGGAGNTAPISSIHFIGWYAYPVANGGGGTGRRVMNVSSCPSETSLVLTAAWVPPDQAQMNFASWADSGVGAWINSGANINYYDNVLAFYSMYYRTGIDSYLHYARWLADAWWTMPVIDRGNSNDCSFNASLCANTPTFPRMFSLTGLYLRAIDQDAVSGVPNSSPMWAGLRMMTDGMFRYSNNFTGYIGDLRENSFLAMYVALCAAYDPDPVHAAACRSDVDSILVNVWKPARASDGSWQAFVGQYTNQAAVWPDVGNTENGLTLSVQPGSNVVTATGGTFQQSWFPAGSTIFTFYSFGDPSTRDSQLYQVTYVDSTHLQISPAYVDNCNAGANSCTGRSWAAAVPNAWVGFGTQPYMLGIAGHWFNQAYIALSLDPAYAADAALAQSYLLDAANWVAKSTLDGSGGTDPATRGALYGVGFGLCKPGNDANSCRCGPNDANCSSATASRENVGEALGAMALAYSYAPSAGLKTAIDNVFSANFAKNPGDVGYDGTYASDLESWFLGTNNPKWFGFFWGMGRNASYLSARQGGLIAPVYITVQVSPGDVTQVRASRFRVTPIDPNGRVGALIVCTSAPCAVRINKVTGPWTFEIAYLSNSGSVISAGRPVTVRIN